MTKKQQLGLMRLQSNLRKKSKILNKRKVIKMLAVMEAQQIAGPSGTNAVTPDCAGATHAEEFLTSGRTGRRNALPDILSEHALVTSSDLPGRLQSLSTNETNEGTSKGKAEPGTSSSS
ncbi:hypothetical protein FQR65_LT06668 [Abscondita terminalis]|nr:hypothetical protein FQR65_LT06668 [Abscondita terminalis]